MLVIFMSRDDYDYLTAQPLITRKWLRRLIHQMLLIPILVSRKMRQVDSTNNKCIHYCKV